MRQVNVKAWLTTIAVIMLAGSATTNAQESPVAGGQTIGQSQPFNLYIIPRGASDINTSIAKMLERCELCNKVENIPDFDLGWKYFIPPRNDCDLHSDLANLSEKLGESIENIHKKQGWNLRDLKDKQPVYCSRKLLGFRIDIASQIMNELSQ